MTTNTLSSATLIAWAALLADVRARAARRIEAHPSLRAHMDVDRLTTINVYEEELVKHLDLRQTLSLLEHGLLEHGPHAITRDSQWRIANRLPEEVPVNLETQL